MKNKLLLDFFREIKHTFSRFLSILLLSALAVAFLAGLRITRPDMERTADVYFDAHNLMDLHILSTLGLTADDISALSEQPDVARAEGGWTVDALVSTADRDTIVKVHSLSKTDVNAPQLLEGRLPINPTECVAEPDFLQATGLQLGDSVTLNTGEDDFENALKRDTFTLVGTVNSPLYLYNAQRGTSSLGSGKVSAFLLLPEENFDMDYTDAYLLMENAADMNCYSDQYDDYMTRQIDALKPLGDVRAPLRYSGIIGEATEKLDDAQKEFDDAQRDATKELSDAEQELKDARKKLDDGLREYHDGVATLQRETTDAQQKIDDATVELTDARQELDENELKYQDGVLELADGKVTLETAATDLEQGHKDYEDGMKTLAEKEIEFADGEAKYNEGLQKYLDGKKEYEDGLAKYNQGAIDLPKAAEELAKAKKQLDSAGNSLNSGYAQYNQGLTQWQQGKAAFDADPQVLGAAALFGYATPDAMMADLTALRNQDIAAESAPGFDPAKTDEHLATLWAPIEAVRNQLTGGIAAAEQGILQLQGAITTLEATITYLQGIIANPSTPPEDLPAAQEQLAAAQAQLAPLQGQLAGAQTQLTALQGQLAQLPASAAYVVASAKGLLASYAPLADAKAQLDSASSALSSGSAQYSAGRKKYVDGKKEYEDGLKEWQDSAPKLEDARQELTRAKLELSDAKVTLDDGRRQLQDGKRELADAAAKLKDGEKEYADGIQDWNEAQIELVDARKKLDDGTVEYQDGLVELEDAKVTLQQETRKAKIDLRDAEIELSDGEKEYQDGLQEYLDGKAEADEKLSDARNKLNDARRKIADIEHCKWYILGRKTNAGFVSYQSDAQRIGNLSAVFPIVFFLVAALVCLTTMTRMVEEQRVQIGGMKALGYSKQAIAFKYVGYGFAASFLGGLCGLALGLTIIPTIIFNAWRTLYTLPDMIFAPAWGLSALSVSAAVATLTGAALWASFSALAAVPAELMRPKAPAIGKRVLLERITPLWRRLNFSLKVAVRNLFRYKKRFWMTVIGIGGCTALIIVGFGLRDSISGVVPKQFVELYHYESQIGMVDDATDDERAQLFKALDSEPHVAGYLPHYSARITAQTDKTSVDATLMAFEDPAALEDFITLRDRLSHQPVPLGATGAVLTEKTASLLHLSLGDTFQVDDGDHIYDLTVSGITENYVLHYIYVERGYYEKITGEERPANAVLCHYAQGSQQDEDAVARNMMRLSGVTAVSSTATTKQAFADSISSVDYAVLIIIISAAALAFVVLYNLTNINITERQRELATLKVLGFYDGELSAYVYRENIFLTIFGILMGLVMGFFLHQYLILTVEIDILMFARKVTPLSYLFAILLTAFFSVVVNLAAHRKLKKIDMVESLKTVE